MTNKFRVGDQVRVSSANGHDSKDTREPYWIGDIVWFSGTELVGVRCDNLGHTIHVVDRERVGSIEGEA